MLFKLLFGISDIYSALQQNKRHIFLVKMHIESHLCIFNMPNFCKIIESVTIMMYNTCMYFYLQIILGAVEISKNKESF